MTLKTYPRTNVYKIARGTPGIKLRRADGTYEGVRWVGNTPAFSLSVETENYQHTNSESGLNTIDLDVPISVTRTSKLTIDNLNNDNIGLFLGAAVTTFVQTSASVPAEIISRIRTDRSYQLGLDQSLAGVRNVTAVVPTLSTSARAASTPYAKGAIYQPATPNNHLYMVTVAGTSAGSLPTFTTDGTTFADGTATVIDLGLISGLTTEVDYIVDGPNALISIPSTGKLAGVYSAAIAAGLDELEFSINLSLAYTRPAQTRREMKAGTGASIRCSLIFKADNAYGENQDVVIPDCTLSPSGELAFVGENEVTSVEFEVGINILDSNTPPVMIVGASA